ncbi:MAG: ATP-dependent DNA helicase [Cyanobacteria bacterium RI_101]|nr:ATP-dependent DNA helicase [Cyanobacteria bacterium RI_101]
MVLLEAAVHQTLKDWRRQGPELAWPHGLTLGRLVSRALRLRRSALIQTGCLPEDYSASYLLPCLLSQETVHLVAPESRLQGLLKTEIPTLLDWLERRGIENSGGKNLRLLSPQIWLEERLNLPSSERPLTLIEQVESLEQWLQDFFTLSWRSADWETLSLLPAHIGEALGRYRLRLAKSLFSRPANAYGYYLLSAEEESSLWEHLENLEAYFRHLPRLGQFWQGRRRYGENYLLWAAVNRELGQFSLQLAPVNLAPLAAPYWRSPLILMGGILGADKEAAVFRRTLGLGELLCLQFTPQRLGEAWRLYLPERLPAPNTPEFQETVFKEVHRLLGLPQSQDATTVVLLDDAPLKTGLGSRLAAEFGSRVKVETSVPRGGALIASWDFWQTQQHRFPNPGLLIFATLPIPSLENPLVASRVNAHKRRHQDWFRDYLLPSALQAIQRAVLPLGEETKLLAILDSRVNSRSYGPQILALLEPYARLNDLDGAWLWEA